jgi:uncharacterized membrane protein (DUF106 family)
MQLFFSIIIKSFNIILLPFKDLPPLAGLSFIALVTGFLAVLIFKYVSNQKALKEIMNRIKIHFAEIILYKDDFRQILLAQKEILKNNFSYFIRTIKPAIPIVAIVLLILSQMNIRYSFSPVLPGEPLTVKLSVRDNPGIETREDVKMLPPFGIKIVTPAFHSPGTGQIEWRIKGNWEGVYDLVFKIGQNSYQKRVLIGPPNEPFSPHLGKEGFVEKVFNPLEKLLPIDSPVAAIDLDYQSRFFKLGISDWSIHWLVAFLVIAIAFGLICRKLLKVS